MLRRPGIPSAGTALLLRRAVAVAAVLLVLTSSGWPSPAEAVTPARTTPEVASASPAIHAPSTRRACALPGRGRAACHAIVRTDIAPLSVRLAAAANTMPSGYGPADLQSAYGLAAVAAAGGSGVTVAVIDAYDDPTAESDLALYRSQYNLPPCTSSGANPCFRKVNQLGESTNLPAPDLGWSTEISLDLDMVSAICPNCSILLVEADTAFVDDLGTAVKYAVSAGAKYISNSYGGPEDASAPTLDSLYYKHAGVVVTASTGDDGYEGYLGGSGGSGNEYPSVSPWVVAVGGTTLRRAANARGWTESAWSRGGSGCSIYEARPSWQPSSMTSCSRRMVADVSVVGDPATGVAVVNAGSWVQVGGTSAGAPIVAAAYALAPAPAAGSWPVSYISTSTTLNDPIGGSNAPGGSCSPDPSLWCTAIAGYDGPTGAGSLNGIAALSPPLPPGAPQSVVAAAANASAAVTWAAPASDGGARVTGYTVTASPGGATCAWTAGPLACTVAGLTNGTSYTFTATATNIGGTGPASVPSASVVPRTVPGKPQSVAAAPGDSRVTVTWAGPATDGGSAITGYTATASPGGSSCAWTGGPYTCDVTGLVNGTAYTFAVTATNGVGAGPASDPTAPVTPRTTPGPPTGVTATAGQGSAQVSWLAPASNGGATITTFTVTSSPDARTCTWSSGPLDCTVTGLTNDTAYTFSVTAANAAGSGPASAASSPVTPVGVPDPPSGVVAVPNASAMGALAVTWSAPADNGSPITSYQAIAFDAQTYASLASCATSAVPPAVPATGCTLAGLGNGVTVVVRVSATNSNGQGLLSAASGPATTPIPAGVMGLPVWTVQPSVTIAWGASPSGAAAGFDVRYRRATWSSGFGSYATWRSMTTAASAAFAPAPGSTYCFSARAIDPQGAAGPWSSERCMTAPLDDRSLYHTGGWTSGTGSAYYRGTWTRAYAYGAKAVRTSVRAKQIVLVATSCRTCGSVRVYLGSTLLRSISLYSATTVSRRVFTVATFSSIRTGTLTVKLSSSGRMVTVDGLGISAR